VSANNTAAAPAKEPAGNKRLLLIGAIVAILLVVGGAAAWLMLGRSAAIDEETGAPRKAAVKAAPTFLALENMVVNLADPGGDRFAQVGVTLELEDAKTSDQVKQYLPAIRSAILILVSQRSAEELLTRDGKELLAHEILREVSKPLGYRVPKKPRKAAPVPAEGEEDDEDRPRARANTNPVRQVLFTSFIIQ
jgi:flagellar FliL protein